MPFRGLKTSIEFPLFPSHESHKFAHERERANNLPFLHTDTIRLLADFLIASANRIRKPADTIRKSTNRTRRFFSKNGRKKSKKLTKTPAFSRFRSIFPARENKNAAKILAESKEESLSQIFRERHLVKF